MSPRPERASTAPETLTSTASDSLAGTAVEMRDVTRMFGAARAVDRLSISVVAGECLGLLGPNGAGKTTTIRMLSTQCVPTSGSIRVLGLDPQTSAAAIRARIGVVPQEIAIYESLTARENLEFFGRLQGLKSQRLRERVDWALERARLRDRATERVEAYSGGMKRRLNIVAALLHEPELIFFDEPTLGIDPQSRSHILEMIEELHAAGSSIIYTTHQLGEVERLCDRIVILDQGRAIAQGSMSELAALHADTKRWVRLEIGKSLEETLRVLRERQIEWRIEEEKPSLEQIFLALTGRAMRDDQ